MKKLVIVFVALASFNAFAGGRKAPAPIETPVHYDCVEPDKKLIEFGPETYKDFLPGGRDHGLAKEAFCLANTVYANGCLERKILDFSFRTLEKDIDPQLKRTENAKAWGIYTAKLPHVLSARKYYTRQSVYGFTYFWRDNDRLQGTETRVWSNFNRRWTPPVYAAHLVHEDTHRALAGAYGHWSTHWASYPYTAGDAAEECIAELQDAGAGLRVAALQEQRKSRKPRQIKSAACEELY